MKNEPSVSEDDLALLSAYEAGEAAPGDRLRAEALLAASAEAGAALARLRALREATAAFCAPALDDVARERIASRVLAVRAASARDSGRPWWPAVLALAAAAGVVLAVALPRLARPPAPPAVVRAVAGGARMVRTGLGDFQLVPIGERAIAFVGEDSEVEVGPPGSVELALRIRRGSARLVVRRNRTEPFVVATPAADVAVMGTEFDVDVDGDAAVVRVVRGEVEVRNSFGRRRLWKNESARAHAGSAPRFVERMKAVVLEGPPEIVAPRRP